MYITREQQTLNELVSIASSSDCKVTICKAQKYRGDRVLRRRGAGVVGGSVGKITLAAVSRQIARK